MCHSQMQLSVSLQVKLGSEDSGNEPEPLQNLVTAGMSYGSADLVT